MVKMQQFLVFAAVAVAMAAQDLPAENQRQESGSSLDESESGDGSAFLGSDPGSFADVVDAPSIGSDSPTGKVVNEPATPAPSPTSPPAVQPVVDGVTMFGQCGGVFYSGSTTCTDPDAYCKELSIYSSICSPKPVN